MESVENPTDCGPPSLSAITAYSPLGTVSIAGPPSVLSVTVSGAAEKPIRAEPPPVLAVAVAALTPCMNSGPPPVSACNVPASPFTCSEPPSVLTVSGPSICAAAHRPAAGIHVRLGRLVQLQRPAFGAGGQRPTDVRDAHRTATGIRVCPGSPVNGNGATVGRHGDGHAGRHDHRETDGAVGGRAHRVGQREAAAGHRLHHSGRAAVLAVVAERLGDLDVAHRSGPHLHRAAVALHVQAGDGLGHAQRAGDSVRRRLPVPGAPGAVTRRTPGTTSTAAVTRPLRPQTQRPGTATARMAGPL